MITYGPYAQAYFGIPNPVGSDVFGQTFVNAQHSTCAQFELNWHHCLEAFGQYLGVRYCDLEFRDFKECVSHDKKASVGLITTLHFMFYIFSNENRLKSF